MKAIDIFVFVYYIMGVFNGYRIGLLKLIVTASDYDLNEVGGACSGSVKTSNLGIALLIVL